MQVAPTALIPVDRLEVQILVDNVSDSLSSVPSFVETEFAQHWRNGLKTLAGSCLCCAAHGLSCLITAWRGDRRYGVLFDTGPDEQVFRRNVASLAVDLGGVDAIVVSHGHWDHAGALFAALELIRGKDAERRVPIHMHPGMFATRALRAAGGAMRPMADVPTPAELQARGGQVVLESRPELLFGGTLLISGEIPRRTPFERGMPGQYRRLQQGDWEPDPLITDERWVGVEVAGEGMVVFSACSHAGIINVLHHARELLPGVPLRCVLGGLHLSGENEVLIPQTVEAIGPFGAATIAAGHCTGWRALTALANRFGDGIVAPLAVGKRFRFGSGG